jgi:hypothetical protein
MSFHDVANVICQALAPGATVATAWLLAGANTCPLFGSTRAVFVNETQQLLPQKVITLS